MIIRVQQPPIIDRIRATFTVDGLGVIYAWGNVIYNPDNVYVSPELIAHEQIHSNRQMSNPLAWWERYLVDTGFRLQEELPAHHAEYVHFCRKNKDRNERSRHLTFVSKRLAAPLYGSLITPLAARRAIASYRA